MSSYTTEVRNLHFNAATCRFEALVVFHEPGEMRSYPTSVTCRIDSEFEAVSRALVDQAKTLRKTNTRHMVARKSRVGSSNVAHISDLVRDLIRKTQQPGQRHAA